MTRYYNTSPRARLNWTAIGGICGVVVCLCAMATVFGEFILPEIKARQKTSDDVDSLKQTMASVAAKADIHVEQLDNLQNDVRQIKQALKIPNSPAAVTAVPSSQALGLRTIAPTPYLNNIATHNTRAENQAKRKAAGLPPAPSAAEKILNSPAALASNSTE